ncbi:MAG: hypothetical protein HXY52_00060 [Nitrospirae bacterium]|nr:hypothetical protein [Nitrospirota bacterium]
MKERNIIFKLVCLLVFIFSQVNLAFSGPDHLNIKVSDFVTLIWDSSIQDCKDEGGQDYVGGFVRVYPDGSKDTQAFRVPTGKRLVITDISINGPMGPVANAGVSKLVIENLSNQSNNYSLTINYTAIGTEHFGAGSNLTTGYVVSDNAKICYPKLHDITISGYIVPSWR